MATRNTVHHTKTNDMIYRNTIMLEIECLRSFLLGAIALLVDGDNG